MANEGFKRKLAAILSADVIGYSRLMRDDEEATVRDIAAHRVLISDIIQQHNGRVVDSPGDNILAEFASVVDAVNGAIKIQAAIKRSNADTPAERRMEFRIGVNLGDVIDEDDRIYGDGVNIAARVEGLASAGGIAISGTVYEHIKDKLSLGYHYLSEQDVKNIPEPVRVYRLLTEPADAGKLVGVDKKAPKGWWLEVAAVIFFVVAGLIIYQFYVSKQTPPAKQAPDEKPSIAVLPFDNMRKAITLGPNEYKSNAFMAQNLVYAQVGRVQEARAIFDKITEKWPGTMKNVRWWISNWPFKDLQVTERFAEGWIRAGFKGEPSGFYKISAEKRLSGEDLIKLFFGRKVAGSNMITGQKWLIDRSEDGKAAIRDGDKSDTGKSWIEEDMLCDQWDNFYESLQDCWVIYRNPEGTPENNDEYLGAPGYGIYPFTQV